MEKKTLKWENLEKTIFDFLVSFITEYRAELDANDKNASGQLYNTLEPVDIKFSNGIFEGQVSIADYWKYIEYGRKPGKFPPVDAIRQWIRVKPVMPRPINGITPTEDQLTFLIGRKIATEGIEPNPLLEKALDKLATEWDKKIEEAIEMDLDEFV